MFVLFNLIISIVLTFLGGFMIGIANPIGDTTVAIAISNLVFASLGFFISGCFARADRLKHLVQVVTLVWVVGALNMFLGITPLQWMLSLIFLFVTMGIGGGLSLLVVKSPEQID